MAAPSIVNVYLVYKILNPINQKCYIGITSTSLKKRINGHLKDMRQGSQSAIHRAIRKYGINSFDISIISDNAKSWKDLCKQEKFFIAKYNSYNNGYNSTIGGDGNYGYKPTEETKQKQSKALKGRKKPPRTKEWCEKISKANKGKKLSKETREKISKGNKGKKLSKDHIKRFVEGRSVTNGDKKIYTFFNKKLGIQEQCTRVELCKKYNISSGSVSRIVNKHRKSASGWEVVVDG